MYDMSDLSNTKKLQKNKIRQVSFFVKYIFNLFILRTIIFSRIDHKCFSTFVTENILENIPNKSPRMYVDRKDVIRKEGCCLKINEKLKNLSHFVL